jgi:PAS domain S-box-containing protein
VRWTDLTPPEWRDRDERAIAEVKTTGACQPYEKEYCRKDGSRVPVLIGAAIFEANGNEGVAFVVDLSEQKRTQEALSQSEGYLAEAQRLSHTGSWARNSETGEIQFLSAECFRILGFDPHGGTPRFETFSERIHPDDRAETREKIERATRERTGYELDYRYILPGGEVRDIHTVAKAVLSPSGELIEFVGTVIDITERKRAEEGLRRAQAELAHVTRVATMGELAASIAHEVNQPIAGVILNANACLRWLARVKDDSVNMTEARETLHHIVRDGNRAGDIVARIKTLFKKAEPAREPLDINEAIREIIVLARGEMTKQRITLQLQLASDLPPVLGDRVQLQQVMMNLILNAIDAMSIVEDRERTLIIKTWKIGDEQVCVEVQDTGIGIGPEDAARIFESFHTTKPGGMGMGLSISRSIVESHAGRLWAAANDGPGATLQFTLPTQPPEGSN